MGGPGGSPVPSVRPGAPESTSTSATPPADCRSPAEPAPDTKHLTIDLDRKVPQLLRHRTARRHTVAQLTETEQPNGSETLELAHLVRDRTLTDKTHSVDQQLDPQLTDKWRQN